MIKNMLKPTSSMRIIFALIVTGTLLTACSDMRKSKPIAPVQDLEMYLVGNLEASFVGTENCLKNCHSHDKIKGDFALSVHGNQITASGLPLVNCESCHGPGSMATEHAREKMICDFDTLFPLKKFPAQAQSLICLKCHSAGSTPTLQFWNASLHATSDVSCFDCHNLHQGPEQKVNRHDMEELCNSCHQRIGMEFKQRSHHPIPEHRMACVDCHNPHGTANDAMLLGVTVKDTCTKCHMAKQGPFVYEHADVNEDCNNCHQSHGSPNDNLLTVSEPFLCLQCHPGHHANNRSSLSNAGDDSQATYYSRCTDCHSSVHGTDIPSPQGRGTFIAR